MRTTLIAVLDKLDRAIALVCQAVVLLVGTAMLSSIAIGVVARYVIRVGGITWAAELPTQLFSWFIMAGVVLAVHGGNHIAVDLLLDVLGRGKKRVLIVAINGLVAAAYFYLTGTALEVAKITSIQRNPVLDTPQSLPFYALAIGLALTAVACLSIALRVAFLGPEAAPQGRPEESVQ